MKKHITEVSPNSIETISSLMSMPADPSQQGSGDGKTGDGVGIFPVERTDGTAQASGEDAGNQGEASPAARPRGGLAFLPWQAAGILLTTVGVGIAIAPSVSPEFAEWLDQFGSLRLHSGTLIVGGLVLFTVNVLRQTLSEMRRSLEDVGGQTARLEEMAEAGQSLRVSLDSVKTANTALTHDVNNLQVQVKRLTEIVSNPDYTVSIFRLAASVDQLGKNLHMHLKEQFEALLGRSTALVEQGEQTERQIATRLDQVSTLLKEQHRQQQASVQEGLTTLQATTERIHAGVDKDLEATSRLDARIQNHQELMSNGFASLAERTALHANQLATAFNELRGRVDRQIEGHSAALITKLEAIDARVGETNRDHTAEVKELGEQLEARIAGWTDDLKQKLRSISEMANSNRQEITNQLDGLAARADDHARNHQAALEQVGENDAETRRAIKREYEAGIEHLEGQLAALTKESNAALRKASQEAQQVLGVAKRELAVALEQIGTSLERQARDQVTAQQKGSHEVQQAANVTRREIATKLEQLAASLDRQNQERELALQAAWQDALAATKAAKQEVCDGVELAGLELDEKIDARWSALSGEIGRLAARIESVVADLRSSSGHGDYGSHAADEEEVQEAVADEETPSLATADEPTAELQAVASTPTEPDETVDSPEPAAVMPESLALEGTWIAEEAAIDPSAGTLEGVPSFGAIGPIESLGEAAAVEPAPPADAVETQQHGEPSSENLCVQDDDPESSITLDEAAAGREPDDGFDDDLAFPV